VVPIEPCANSGAMWGSGAERFFGSSLMRLGVVICCPDAHFGGAEAHYNPVGPLRKPVKPRKGAMERQLEAVFFHPRVVEFHSGAGKAH
jgi:hypothetical protein